MTTTLKAALSFSLALPHIVYSDELDDFRHFYGDEQTVGIATGYSRPLAESPSVVTVITADDIRKRGAVSIEELLETVPGFHVSSANGFVPAYVVRGIFSPLSSHVLVMQDGVPVNDPVNSGKLFSYTHLTKNISRIEIIRGPGSALYGADAFAGVINIITKTGREIGGGEIGALAGSFDNYGGWALLGKRFGDFDLAFSAQGRTALGQQETVKADAQTRMDRLFNTQASLAPGPINVARDDLDVGASLRYRDTVKLHLRYQDFESANGVGTTLALDPDGSIRYQSWTSGLDLKQRFGDFEPQFNLNYFFYKATGLNHHFPAGAFGGTFFDPVTSTYQYFSHTVDATFKTLYDGFKNHRVTVGAGYKYAVAHDLTENRNFLILPNNLIVPAGPLQSTDSLGVEALSDDADRHIVFGFVQDEWNIANDWTLTTGLRLDHYSDFGLTANPRASLVWQVDPSLSAKLMVGRAFRAPSFIELYSNEGLQLRGNPNLKPETIDTVELSFAKKWKYGLSTGINLFGYSSADLIAETSSALRTFENSAGAVGYGFEWLGQYRYNESLTFDLNYTYLRLEPKNSAHDNFIIGAPQHDIFAQINWRFLNDWHVNVRSDWIIGRQRAAGDDRDAVGDYVLVGFNLRREQIMDGLALSFKVDNLFDVKARHPSINSQAVPYDYPIAGIAFLGQAELSF
ncbi:TonB-dependent receptor plug domain-containing protein [Methylotuvimicrobium sp. KM1]|uniref:TonB-dependent receptor plug domain-containing protein n=1 Tax=Methylotuvimicrobium sp. KM1 TaxID=3377707 RepID=UPI00384BB30D